jgi:transcriptional regulator with XRE-family HTH domain
MFKPGQKIRMLRRLKGYSQEQVAGALGITQGAYGKIERGESEITLTRLDEIARVLQVTPVDILLFDPKAFLHPVTEN